ncbi:MerR family transcriptional regulator [Ketogulonicigenium robustum]|uniref:MerR family transcriptional regulator n=1 Tax=Ketogulonicigenium robustum TaxID=92947 RepID=A0A1W6NWH2_9RHOB|nr:Cu(I)-responsive transcriptional regulator [Ketogulonicigenium robustum]ARO13572.1 MerR family transcriptional regulator [Ketogulonicigenium robustum]
MNIGEAGAQTGLSAKMIRYYEQVGLIAPAARSVAGYRHYGPKDIEALRFISRCRHMGFGIDQIRDLLGLWRDPHRASADVKALATSHAEALARQAAELLEMSDALGRLAASCHGDGSPDCAILDEFATAPAHAQAPISPPRFGVNGQNRGRTPA